MASTNKQSWLQKLAEVRNNLDEDWQRTSRLLEKVSNQEPFSQEDLGYMKQIIQRYQKSEGKPLYCIPLQPNPKDWQNPTWEELVSLRGWVEKYYHLLYEVEFKLIPPFPKGSDQREKDLENLVKYLNLHKFPPTLLNQNWRDRLAEKRKKLDEGWQKYLALLEKVKNQEPLSQQDRDYMRKLSHQRQNRRG